MLWRRFDASSLRRLSSASCFLRSAASSRAASCSDVKAWLLLLFVDASFSFIMALCWRIASSCAAFFARRSAAVSLALEGRADARPAPKELWRAPNVLRSFETWPGFVDLAIEDVRGLVALDALPSAGGCGPPMLPGVLNSEKHQALSGERMHFTAPKPLRKESFYQNIEGNVRYLFKFLKHEA